MKVFLSWSGGTSKKIAEIFREWLPQVIQVVKPYFSPEDTVKGTRWHSEISRQLEDSKAGLIFLTPDNTEAQWLMFEAGALSKHVEKDLLCPICFEITTTDVRGPLSHFQCAVFDKKEMKKILTMLNQALGSNALEKSLLAAAFEKWWPDLNVKIEKALGESSESNQEQHRSDRELLEEILNLTRESATQVGKANISDNEIQNLVEAFYDLIDHIVDIEISNEIKSFLTVIYVHLSKLIDTLGYLDNRFKNRLEGAIELLNQAKLSEI